MTGSGTRGNEKVLHGRCLPLYTYPRSPGVPLPGPTLAALAQPAGRVITLSARSILIAGNVPLKGTYDVQVEAHCDKPTISLQPNSAAGVSLARAGNG